MSSKYPTTLVNDDNVRIIALFDNEEIGSVSAYGADSNLLVCVLNRLAALEIDSLKGSKVCHGRGVLGASYCGNSIPH